MRSCKSLLAKVGALVRFLGPLVFAATILIVSVNRFLKYINTLIGILLLVSLWGIYWYAWRPMPQVSGTLSAPISAEATVARDSLGVPHIVAASEADALFVQGYVTAQDRLWQMDAIRRLAGGTLSEVVGPAALESDRASRRLRLWRIAEEQSARMSAADRAGLTAYANGVNYFLETHHGNLPLEFRILEYDPRPWTVADSILVGLQMIRTLSTSWEDEIQKQSMFAAGDRAKVELLFPVWTGDEGRVGSNAWAVSGAHTASGRPMLANDMHLEFTIPSTWYMVHLKADDLNVSGVSLPGLPGVIVGHNNRIAWGITNLGFDVQDLYYEDLDTKTGRYTFRGQSEQARLENELIPVKGEKPVENRQWVTRHGPVSFTYENRYMALKWIAQEDIFAYPFLELDRAQNWQQFRAALSRIPAPSSNLVYADVDGNIGYQTVGRLPIRKDYDGSVPVEGTAGKYEWEGYIPFEDLPSIYNPPSGFLVTANQNPFPRDYKYRVSGYFAPGYRSRQIRAALERKQHFEKPEEMVVIQKDVYSGFLRFLARELAAAFDRRKVSDPRMGSAVEILRGWDGQVEKGRAAPMISDLAYQHLRRAIADAAAPGKGQEYRQFATPAVVENLVRGRPAGWFKDWDEALLDSLRDGLAEGDRIQGADPRRWDYGVYNSLSIRHPIGGRLPLVYPMFNIGPMAMSGASTTIKQLWRNIGPSERFVADTSNWDQSLMNLTIGQSGHVLSSHYKDQWSAFYTGTSFPMRFEKFRAEDVLILRPGGN